MKIKSLIIILILLPTLLYGRNALPKVTYNNMEFIDVADDNAVEPVYVLNRYLGSDNKVIVPDSIMYNGTNYAVKGIAQLAFFNSRDFLKEIYLPNSVTRINEDVFSGCKKLEYVKLPEKLSSIGARAFQDCVLINKIVFPTSLKHLGQCAFSGCKSLNVVIFTSDSLQLWKGESWQFPFSLCNDELTLFAPQSLIDMTGWYGTWRQVKWKELTPEIAEKYSIYEQSEKPKTSADSFFDYLFYFLYDFDFDDIDDLF